MPATISLPLTLPDDAEQRQTCTRCIEDRLQRQAGISSVKINSDPPAAIELAYDPQQITLSQINDYLRQAGGCVSPDMAHIVLPVRGLVSPRHEMAVQRTLKRLPGVRSSASFASQTIRIEFDRRACALPEIVRRLENLGITLRSPQEAQDKTIHNTNLGDFSPDLPPSTSPSSTPYPPTNHPSTTPLPPLASPPHWFSTIFHATDMLVAISAGLFLLAGFFVHILDGPQPLRLSLLIVSYILGGWYPSHDMFATLRRFRVDIDVLMFAAAFGAASLGHYEEGALLLFLFSLGGAGERLAMDRARSAINALAKLAPTTATRIEADGSRREVGVGDLAIGDRVLVQPGQQVPCDGVVESGSTSINQAPITGESAPVPKSPGSEVFAGTINGEGVITCVVAKPSNENTIAKVIRLVEEAQTTKSSTQVFTDQVEKWYVPLVLAATGLLIVVPPLAGFEPRREHASLWAGWFYQAMAFLTAASPCALAIGTPAAVLSGIARAARGGVLIKGGNHLENLGRVRAIAFDKTGTLTRGQAEVTDIIPLDDSLTEDELLRLAAAVESTSHHPLADAIAGEAQARDMALPEVTDVQQIPGLGIRGKVEGRVIAIGRPTMFDTASEPKGVSPRSLVRAEGRKPSDKRASANVDAVTSDRGLTPLGSDEPFATSTQAFSDASSQSPTRGGDAAANSQKIQGLANANERIAALQEQGKTAVVVADESRVLGLIALADQVRPGAAAMIATLHRLGIRKTIMLTGDNRRTAAAVAKIVGIDEYLAELLPDEKLARVRQLDAEHGRVAMVGDGINDAPAMANATVGLAMGGAAAGGGGSDVALETADVVLLANDLAKIPEAIGVSRFSRRIVIQNLVIALGVIAFLAPAAALGFAPIGAAVLFHEGSTVVVVLNSLRTLAYRPPTNI